MKQLLLIFLLISKICSQTFYVEPKPNNGNCTLDFPCGFEEALQRATPNSTLFFLGGTYFIELIQNSNLPLPNGLRFEAIGPIPTIWSGNEDDRILYLSSNSFSFHGIQFRDGSNLEGGLILLENTLSVRFENCSFVDHAPIRLATVPILIQGQASAVFSNCVFRNNTSSSYSSNGGVISLRQSGTVEFYSCNFSLNTVSNNGGAISLQTSSFSYFSYCSFDSNRAASGGALALLPGQTGQILIENCKFKQNIGAAGAGGILVLDGFLEIINTNFSANFGGLGAGSALLMASASANVTFTNCRLENHTIIAGPLKSTSGTIFNAAGNLKIINTDFFNNSVGAGTGSGISTNGPLYVFNSNFVAGVGLGAISVTNELTRIEESLFINNSVDLYISEKGIVSLERNNFTGALSVERNGILEFGSSNSAPELIQSGQSQIICDSNYILKNLLLWTWFSGILISNESQNISIESNTKVVFGKDTRSFERRLENLTLINYGNFFSEQEDFCLFIENVLFINIGTVSLDCTIHGTPESIIENRGIWQINHTSSVLDFPFISYPTSSLEFVLREIQIPLMSGTNLTIDGEIVLLRDYPYWPKVGDYFTVITSPNPISENVTNVRSDSDPNAVMATIDSIDTEVSIRIDELFLVAQDDFVTTLEDEVVKVLPLLNDYASGGILNIIRTNTLRATPHNEEITVTPTTNFAGVDSVSYTVSDALGNMVTASIRVTFLPVNDPPNQPNDYIIPIESSEVIIILQGSDVDSDIMFILISLPSDGALTDRNGTEIETVPYSTLDNVLMYQSSVSNRRSVNFQYLVTDGEYTTNPITVQLVTNPSNNVTQTIALSAVFGFLGLWLFCASIIWFLFIIKKKYFTDEESDEMELSSMGALLGDLQLEGSPVITGHGLSLTSGFGTAIAGSWKDQNVLTKSIPLEDLSLYNKFKPDSLKYQKLKPHPNVATFFGAIMGTNEVIVVYEYPEEGCLFDLLHSDHSLELEDKIGLCYGIAKGLNYLHKEKIIHKSLSSRSVLISNGEAKITDYGLAKLDTFEEFKDKTRWLAPEALKKKQLTRKTDVFSYGVTVWEITTRKEPYSNVDSKTAIALILQNYHLPIPQETPSLLTEIMHGSWETDPKNRFSMQDIVNFFPKTNSNRTKKKFNMTPTTTTNSLFVNKKLKNRNV